MRPTVKQITGKFIWPGINKQVREWAQMCVNYLTAKVTAIIDLLGWRSSPCQRLLKKWL